MAGNIDIFKTVAHAVNQTAMVTRIPENDYESFKNTVQGMTVDQLSANGLINEFIATMMNTIGRHYMEDTFIHSRFGRFYRDSMEFGRFIAVAGVAPAVGIDYVGEMEAETFDQFNPFLGQKPDAKVYYYQLNERRRYAIFLNYMDFKQAFNDATWGFQTFIMKFINSAMDGRMMDVDNFVKETFNDIINATGTGNIKLALKSTQKYTVPGFDTAADSAASLKSIQDVISNMVNKASPDFNEANFMNMQRPDRLMLFIRQDALNGLNTLAMPFVYNANKLTFEPAGLGASVEVFAMPDFGGITPQNSSNAQIYPKYNGIGQWDGTYVTTSGGSTPATFDHWADPNANVLAVLCDAERLMIVNNKLFSRQTMNDATGNSVYHLHDWNMFTQNQFRNFAVFTKAAG